MILTNNSDSPKTNKHQNLYFILSGIFLTNAIVAEIIGAKIFSLEKTLGLPPAQIHLSEKFVLDFNLTAGVMIWPVVFITSDIINEYFGKKGVQKISYFTAILISYSFIVITIATLLYPADFWAELSPAFNKVFTQSLGIIAGSIVAFLIGQVLDAAIFQYFKKITGDTKIWLRATGSTLISQLIDSFVVLWIAFYVFGNWSMEQLISVATINYIYKFAIAILLTPILYLLHFIIDKYLGIKK
jgi:queuosine precursor transporter